MASDRTISRLPGVMGRLAAGMFVLVGIVCAAACTVNAGVVVVGHDINTPGIAGAGSQGVAAVVRAPPNTHQAENFQATVAPANRGSDFPVAGALAAPSEGVNSQRDPEAESGVELARAAERPPVERIASLGFAVGGPQYPATGFSLCSVRLRGDKAPASGDFQASWRTMKGVGPGSAAVPRNAGNAEHAAVQPKATTAAGRRYSFYSPTMSLLAETEIKTDTGKPVPLYEYVWFNGHPVAQIDAPSSTHWTFTDHLGTPLIQTDTSGTVSWRAEYEPYGKVFAYNPPTLADQHQPLRLPGQEAEQLNLGPNGVTERSYNIFRWYRSAWGRYAEPDPAGFFRGGGVVGARNSYGAVQANPVAYTDPLGLFTMTMYPPHRKYFKPGEAQQYCGPNTLGCTRFLGRRLDWDCTFNCDLNSWSIEFHAFLLPYEFVPFGCGPGQKREGSVCLHEDAHIADMGRRLTGYYEPIEKMRFPSFSDCDSRGVMEASLFSQLVDAFMLDSNALLH